MGTRLHVVAGLTLAAAGLVAIEFGASLALGRQAPARPAFVESDLRWTDLLPPTGFDGWEMIAAEGQTPDASSWSRSDGELHASGKPTGYLRTARAYDDFVLEFEWKYPEGAPGNSGVLVHVEPPDKVWPKCVQVQMLNDSAGRMFPMNGADAGDSAPSDNPAAPAGTWNHWRLEALGDHLTLKVRRKDEWVEANTVIVRSPSKGHIGLQSEDSPVVFRRIRLATLPTAEGDKPADPKAVPPAPTETAQPDS